MGKRLVVHGHFSQPFRIDPTLGEVLQEPTPGGYLSHHHRALRECYGANSASRLLSGGGTIRELFNTFAYLSFSFNPLLLGWIERNGPNVYRRILEADAQSAERLNGHGNAIAEPYAHGILPLDAKEDVITRIRYGLEDFRRRFGRDSEGLWLPECAINTGVVDTLIDLGVGFVVLSPGQATATARRGNDHWKNLDGQPLPDDMVYRIQGRSGELTCFTYDAELARGIVFGGLLKNGETLFKSVEDAFAGTETVSIATDGEVYGITEPFGDMALAALIHRVENVPDIEFSNYGVLASTSKEDRLVKIDFGPEGRGTSWSCPHGVARWSSPCDCGQTSGDTLRPDLRKAMRDWLASVRRPMTALYGKGIRALGIEDPAALRNDYATVVAGLVAPDSFAGQRVPRERSSMLLRYLESQRYMLLAHSSYGWFAPGERGAAPLTTIAYLREAVLLLPAAEREKVLPAFNEGRSWYGDDFPAVSRDEKGLMDMIPGAVFLLRYLHRREAKGFGHHRFVGCEVRPESSGEGARGQVTSIDLRTQEERSFPFSFRQIADGVTLEMFDGDLWRDIPLGLLPWESKRDVVRIVRSNLEEEFFSDLPAIFEQAQNVLQLSKTLGVQPSPVIIRAVELGANRVLEDLVPESGRMMARGDLELYEGTMDFCARYAVEMDQDRLFQRITRHIAALVDRYVDERAPEIAEYCLRILRLARAAGIHPDITIAQTLLFPLVRGVQELGPRSIAAQDEPGYRDATLLLGLGREFLIDLETVLEATLALN